MKIALVMGSDSDWGVMKQAAVLLEEFEVSFHKQVLSAHRTPFDMLNFAKEAKANGYSVIIAGAGGAAHLPGMIASATTLPVIGVPVRGPNLEGMDSLLSIVQMPKGIPVATVAINNAQNAALLALRILATSDQDISIKLAQFQEKMSIESRQKTENLK